MKSRLRRKSRHTTSSGAEASTCPPTRNRRILPPVAPTSPFCLRAYGLPCRDQPANDGRRHDHKQHVAGQAKVHPQLERGECRGIGNSNPADERREPCGQKQTSAPSTESSKLSASSIPTILDLPAPSASRTAISRTRVAARASITPATFAQAISKASRPYTGITNGGPPKLPLSRG